MNVFNIIYEYKDAFISGLLVTFKLAIISWVCGLFFGFIIGMLGAKLKKGIGLPLKITSFFLSGIPILVLLFWLNYPLQAILNITINPFITACVALSIINIFSVAEIIKNALNEFPEQYILAGRVNGISSKRIFYFIKFPIIIRQVLPSLLFLQVTILQSTLFASLISVNEIFRVAQQINSILYKPIEIYSALAIFFLLICLPLNGFALWIKTKYTRNISEK